MRVVQVANFYGPRSGGLRTAVDRLGAEYCAAGHEVFLVVPGRYSDWRELPSGVVRISLPARLIPFTGGYRAVLPGPVTSLLGTALARRTGGLGPADPAIAGRMGPTTRRGHRHDLPRTPRSPCRTDTSGPHGAVDRQRGQPPDRRQLRRGGLHDGVRPRRVRPHPRAERRDGAPGCRPRPVPSAPPLGDGAAALGAPRTDPSGALRAPFGREARASQHRYRCRAA